MMVRSWGPKRMLSGRKTFQLKESENFGRACVGDILITDEGREVIVNVNTGARAIGTFSQILLAQTPKRREEIVVWNAYNLQGSRRPGFKRIYLPVDEAKNFGDYAAFEKARMEGHLD